ncbi:hypothetical protein JOD55_000344 [Arcanobacterium pluranimalium]|uniref:TadE family protein n=1 Tax=Arcanobacterium pluranimalium TaxID=108028 RepID=UPI00195A2B66|nr:TadE family protein [Arcanobacterium pluranimalium]MBM7824517.1 hypothetical protein [Arcanobacterium pluranimalium]
MKSKNEAGMVSVEWALTVPTFLALAVFCVSGIFQLTTLPKVNNAAHEAARSYSLGMSESDVRELVHSNAGDDAQLRIERDGEIASIEVTKPGEGVFKLININFSTKTKIVIEPRLVHGEP